MVKLALALVGPGMIGKQLLQQLELQTEYLASRLDVAFELIAVANSRKMLIRQQGMPPEAAPQALQQAEEAADLARLTEALADVRSSGRHVAVVDCTASDAVAEHYPTWLGAGLHVVTPNKRLGAGPLARYTAAAEATKRAKSMLYVEGTVGAGLPVLSTLQSVLHTGDKVLSIEGVFSGTLSFILNTLSGGGGSAEAGAPKPSFSKVVRRARDAGYTEADPREDLAGMDVARKVLILARQCGASLELADVAVTPLLSEQVQNMEGGDVEAVLSALGQDDEQWEAKLREAAANGNVLRYVGRYDAASGECSVKLHTLAGSHPFAALSGSDNIISFTTERYRCVCEGGKCTIPQTNHQGVQDGFVGNGLLTLNT